MKVYSKQASLADVSRMSDRKANPNKARGRLTAQVKSGDNVRVSKLAAEVREAEKALEAKQEQRLNELRAMIEAGTYEVSAEDLADSILRDEVLPWLSKKD